MNTKVCNPGVAPAPEGIARRLCGALFPSTGAGLLSLALIAALAWSAWSVMQWAVIHAVNSGDPAACRTADGACWSVVAEKGRLVLLGRYPQELQWRPILASILLLLSLGTAAQPSFFGRRGAFLLVLSVATFVTLLAGGVAGLEPVPTDLWGGLPLTLLLAAVSTMVAFPVGIVLALGRRSRLPLVRWFCIGYIELIRGMPLITLLFFGAFVLPLLLPAQWRMDMMARIAICLTLFSSAYLAEVFRGGLQAVVKGQYEAAQALGITPWQALNHIVLPQALRITIGPMASNFIGAVKDTSLVAIVNIYDMTGALKLAMSDPDWRPYFVEMYIVVSAIYLVIGISIAQYGRFLERRYALK
jgi:general L-amino acid transport system permease protein